MIKKTSSNQPRGRDSEYITGAFLKSFSILTTSGLSILLHDVISLTDATSYDKVCYVMVKKKY